MKTRLNKYLADRGFCSRRKADELISSGSVLVNGKVATLGMQVDDQDTVELKGSRVKFEKPKAIYLAYHKPVGIITSVDPKARDSVLSRLKLKDRVFPIGRLDVASSGLLLLTNDGRLSERITHPRYDHQKEYLVTVDKALTDGALQTMANGVMILGSMTKPCEIFKIDSRTFRIILTEGCNRQIRRMCEAMGYAVEKLVRTRVMNISLSELPLGAVRPLNDKEVQDLIRMAMSEPRKKDSDE